jgi:hypothetical protein
MVHICNSSYMGGIGKKIVVWGWLEQNMQDPI